MNITLKTTGTAFPTDLEEFVDRKFAQLDRIASGARLECSLEQSIAVERAGAKYKADGHLNVNGQMYHASAEGDTLEAALDEVRDELASAVQSASGKERSLVRRGGAAIKRMLRMGR